MTVVESFHSILDRTDWSADDLKSHLARLPDDGTLNDPSPFRDPPLVRLLQSDRCSADVVRMLLDKGASVLYGAPLTVAVRNCGTRTEKIVRELLLRGASARELDKFNQSCVCNALQAGAPPSVFRLLLDAGCSPDLCRNHVSVLHCASFRPESGFSMKVLQMFLDTGADVLRFGSSGQSPLCFALRGGLDAPGLQVLLGSGASVDACGRHMSSLLCATDLGWGRKLRADVVRTLLRDGAATGCVNGNGWTPLHLALRYLAYETDAVKALLDIPGVDVNGPGVGWKLDSLLHLAVHNSHCTLALVKLLLARGAQLDKVNRHGDTPLHYAVANEDCQSSVIRFLLQKRAAVNARNKYNKSPLRVAIERECSVEVLHLLLGAGAKLGVLKDKMDYSLLRLFVDLYEKRAAQERARERERAYFAALERAREREGAGFRDMDKRSHHGLLAKDSETCLSYLLKRLRAVIAYSFLENAEVTMEYLSGRWRNSPELLKFPIKCSEEVKKMATMDVGRGHTLLEFLNSRSRCNKRPKSKYYKFCHLLAIVGNFPTFFTVIAEKVGVESMKASLRELKVSVVKESNVSALVESKISAVEDFKIPAMNDSSGSIGHRVLGVCTVANSSCSLREVSCSSTASDSSVFTAGDICGPTMDNSTDSVAAVFSICTVETCTDDFNSSTVRDSKVPTVKDFCDSTVDVSSVSKAEISSDSTVETSQVSLINVASKVVTSSASFVDDSRVSTVGDSSDSTVEDFSVSEVDTTKLFTVGNSRISTVGDSSDSTVDTSRVSTVDDSKAGTSTVSLVDDSRVSTIDDYTVQEPNRAELRVYLNYECLCDLARFLSASDLLSLVLAFGVSCKNAVAVQVSKDVQPKKEPSPPSSDKTTEKQESSVNKFIPSNAGPSQLSRVTKEHDWNTCKKMFAPSCSKHKSTCCHHKQQRNSHEPYWKKKKKRKNSSFPSTSSDENHEAPPKRRQKKRKRTSRCKIPTNAHKTDSSSQDS